MGSNHADKNNEKQKKMKSDKKEKRTQSSDSNGKAATGVEMVSDPRFASVHTDPRFQRVPKHKTKVAIDSRFSTMFTDKNFVGSSAPLDKRGRRKKQDSNSALRHYYQIEEDEEKDKDKAITKDMESEEEESEKEEPRKPALVPAGSVSSSQAEAEAEAEAESSEDSDGDDVDDEVEEVEDDSTTDEDNGAAGLLFEDDSLEVEVENVPVVEDGTRRLAAVNMDWRHVRAADLFVVLRSFLPSGGVISSVAVYPSEFGLERMKAEEVRGPVGLFDDNDKNEGDDSDDEIDEDKLRAYEKSRLRYYFAVVECDSIATAEYLYKVCDGVEFERSSNVLDLRFIPDSMEFKHPPRDIATEVPGSYDGIDFHTKALQHSNIPISWDEDEPQRVKTLKRKFNADQLDEKELQEFLASDEGESDDNEDDVEDRASKMSSKGDKYRALIQSGDGSDEEEEEGQDMEVTFNTGLENLSKRLMEKKDKKSETVWEEYLRKRKEKKAARKQKSKSKYSSDDESSSDDDEIGVENAEDFFVDEPSADDIDAKKVVAQGKGKKGKKSRKQNENESVAATTAELELLLADDEAADNGPKGYNLKPKKSKKGKKGKEVGDESTKQPAVDYGDARFSSLYTSPLFALDPTDPQFKSGNCSRIAAYARQMAEKQLKGDPEQSIPVEPEMTADEQEQSNNLQPQRAKHELSTLVKSIKMKSKQLEQPSNGMKSKKEQKSNKSKRTKLETGART